MTEQRVVVPVIVTRKNVLCILGCILSILSSIRIYFLSPELYTMTSVTATVMKKKESSIIYERPLLMMSNGCEGSTAIYNTADLILRNHGLTPIPHNYELLTPEKNPLYQHLLETKTGHTRTSSIELKQETTKIERIDLDTMVQSVLMLHQQAKEQGQFLFFKITRPEYNAMSTDLIRLLDPIFVGTYRENALDRCVCHIRDCFNKSFNPNLGYPVFAANNTRTDLCMKRRLYPDSFVKAFINKDAIISDTIKRHQRNIDNILNRKGLFSSLSFVASEESLFAYEYTDNIDIFNKCLDLWTDFLKPYLGEHLFDEHILYETLQKSRNTRKLKYHDEVIQNIDEIINVMKNNNFDSYLRIRPK